MKSLIFLGLLFAFLMIFEPTGTLALITFISMCYGVVWVFSMLMLLILVLEIICFLLGK